MSTFELLTTLLKGGLIVTLEVTFFATILALVMGFVAGLGRLSRHKLVRAIVAIYVEIFRGTSLLVQLFWIYFALPIFGLELPAVQAGILAIGLNYGAYASEVVRSAIEAVPQGQTEAGIALNMTRRQRLWKIIIPQAFVAMLPNLGNQLIELLKSTSLVSLITLADLTYQANILKASTMETTKIYSLLLVIYFIIAWPLTKAIAVLETKLSAGRY